MSYLSEHLSIIAKEKAERERRRQEALYQYPSKYAMRLLPVRDAEFVDYLEWMVGFLATGGKPTHHYDYNMPSSFKVALTSFALPHACGALSIEVIVPYPMTVTPGGHCHIFRMDGFTHSGFVPMYNDIARML